MPQPIAAEASVTVPFTPEELWPFVANTNGMDRAVGLPRARFTRVRQEEGGERHLGEYALLGRTFARWTEHPFEWERPRRYTILREYQRGPFTRYHGGAELLPAEGGTRIRVFGDFTPRRRLLAPLIRYWYAPLALRRACRQYRAIATYLAGRAANPFPDFVRDRSPADLGRLDALLARLRGEGVPAEVAERLRLLLAEAPDEEVAGMRPLELAGRWGTDPDATLEAFLRATVAGLLEVRWELLCPSCRGVKAEARHLRELQTTGECSACNLHFAADMDEAIEARFYPAPSVRAVEVATYCAGGPMSTPHRLAQILLDPGEAREWRLDLAAGPHTLRSPQSRGASRLLVQSGAGPGEADARVAVSGRPRAEPGGEPAGVEVRIEPAAITPDESRLAAGRVAIRLANGTPDRVTVALDDARWPEGGATPSRLMLLPAFHRLFSAEALAPGVELAIGRVGLLFTDLAGSTALYEAAGDARAFRLVGEHFAIVRGAVEAAGGAMVKTIGDAVMAAFPDGRAAVAAGLAIQREIRALETGGWADPARLVKVGVHAGACFAVTLNERLDYFGTAVNLAARAQREARGGEVVATVAAFDEAVAEVSAAGLAGEPFEASLRGLRDPVRLYRIDCRPIGELARA